MEFQTLKSALSTVTFQVYDTIHDIICLPDGSVENDPLSGQVKSNRTTKRAGPKSRINFFDSFLFCFFSRFNINISIEKYHVDYIEFKRVFIDELRNGAMRNWKVSTNKRDKGIILTNIEKTKLDRYTFQWIADFHDIIIIIDDKNYIPRKVKDNKPVLQLNYNEDGYKLQN